MLKRQAARHFRDVFHWSPAEGGGVVEALAAALGMAGPIVVGVLTGHEAAGFAVALGGLAVGKVEVGAHIGDHLRREIEAVIPAQLAAAMAVALANGLSLWGLTRVVTVVAAALAGGFSRPMVIASTRFIIFLMIVGSVPDISRHGGFGLLLPVALGAGWTSALRLGLVALTRGYVEPQATPPPRRPGAAQSLRYWLRSLRRFSGWTYAARLGACMIVAAIFQWAWPAHHFHWIGLTVALLISRRSEPNMVKMTQRILGTAIGVVVAGLTLRSPLPATALIAIIGLLAGARSHVRQRNYLAYSVVMTLLVVLVIDAGQPPDLSLLADRLLATVIGGLLVILSDRIFMSASPSDGTKGEAR